MKKRRRLALIECGEVWSDTPAKVCDMYRGTRFLAALAYTESMDYRYVISCHFGLLRLEEVIAEPRESDINTIGFDMRDQWAREITTALSAHIQAGTHIVVLANDLYAAPLKLYLPGSTEYPFTGMDEEAQKRFLGITKRQMELGLN